MPGREVSSAGCKADLRPGTCSVSLKQQFPGDLAAAEQLKPPMRSEAEGEEDRSITRHNF